MSPCLRVGLQAECSGNDLDAKKGNVRWSAYGKRTRMASQEELEQIRRRAKQSIKARWKHEGI